MKYRKKPVVIEAVQLRWNTWSEVCNFANVGTLADGKPEGCFIDENGSPRQWNSQVMRYSPTDRIGLLIPTKEGLMTASENDWIIRGVQGELYPCKPDIFEMTYELVEQQ